MIRARLRNLHRGQGGLTVVEMIITMALTGIVMGAIFSVYLLLYRVQTTWQDKSQARAIGLVAEQRLQEDLQRYTVTQVSPDLVLSAATTSSGPSFSITYKLDQSRLTRMVTGEPTATVVAHGVTSFTPTCNNSPTPWVSVQMAIDVTGTAIPVAPAMRVTLRNQSTCPPPS